MTHLGNRLPNMIHRHHHPIWKGLSNDEISIMLIMSDVAPVAGLPDGTYDCFGSSVEVEGTNVRSATMPCLAGSGALILNCINHLCSIWPLHYRADKEDVIMKRLLIL